MSQWLREYIEQVQQLTSFYLILPSGLMNKPKIKNFHLVKSAFCGKHCMPMSFLHVNCIIEYKYILLSYILIGL